MKLSTLVAIAAVIGGSFLIPNPAEARNGWVHVGKGSRTQKAHYVKRTGTSGPFVKFQWQTTGSGSWNSPHLADSNGWRYKDLDFPNPTWDDVLPGTIGDSVPQAVCR